MGFDRLMEDLLSCLICCCLCDEKLNQRKIDRFIFFFYVSLQEAYTDVVLDDGVNFIVSMVTSFKRNVLIVKRFVRTVMIGSGVLDVKALNVFNVNY